MKKKYLSIMLVLIMVFTMLPGTTASVSGSSIGESNPLAYVMDHDGTGTLSIQDDTGNSKITSKLDFSASDSQDCTNTAKHIPHTHEDGRKCWEWDNDNATLTLDGINLEVSGGKQAIYFGYNLSNVKLVLKGNNIITHKNSTDSGSHAILTYKDLEISGTGAVTINGSDQTGYNDRTISTGIYTGGKLRITSGSVTAVAGAVSSTGTEYYTGSESYGLWGYGGVDITGGTVNAIGGNVESDHYGTSYGICHGSGGISLLGGTVTAQAPIGHKPFSRMPNLVGMVHKADTGSWNNTLGAACTYEPAPPFVAVADIIMTNVDSVQVNTDLTLEGTVSPSDATNHIIVWSVQNAGDTGAMITGNTFRATAAGTATIKAAVTEGSGTGSDYTKDFTITVNVPPTPGGGSGDTGGDTGGGTGGGAGGGASAPVKNEGKLEKDQKQEGNAPTANIKDSAEELKAKVLSTAEQDFNHLRLTAKADKSSQKLSYAKVTGADGYFIYGAEYGQKLKLLADVDATVTEYTVKKLKQSSYYRYQVKAYKLIDGEKIILMTSKVIYSVTEGKKYVNPSKITTDTTSVELAVGKNQTLNCRLVLPKGKRLKEYTAAIRYESTNKAVATVNSKGKITAKKKGTCYVYAYAQNGVYKKIKVTVK